MIALNTCNKIRVGSKNPVKIKAVESIFTQLWYSPEVLWENVSSNVSDMPSSVEETEQWAINRALKCIAFDGIDMWIWLEWWVSYEKNWFWDEVCYIFWAVAVIDKLWNQNVWWWWKFTLPLVLAEALKAWKELGPVMSALTGIENIKQKWWAVGYLTDNIIPRQKSFETIVLHALVPWINQKIYTDWSF